MSSPPRLSAAARSMPLSIFARLYEKVAGFTGDVITLQIGDTHLGPPATARFEQLGLDHAPDREIYHYGPAPGWRPLVERLRAKVERHNRIPVGQGGIQVTAGATHALWCALGAVCDPGDELLLLAPHWPLIRGIALSRSVVPVEAPFTQVLRGGGGGDPVAAARAARHVPDPRDLRVHAQQPRRLGPVRGRAARGRRGRRPPRPVDPVRRGLRGLRLRRRARARWRPCRAPPTGP